MTPARHTQPSPKPVVFVHAAGTVAPTRDWLASLKDAGFDLFSHGELDGCGKTGSGVDRLGSLLRELGDLAPGRPVLIVRSGLDLSPSLFERLERLLSEPETGDVFTVLSNGVPSLNPYAGLAGGEPDRPAVLVELLGSPVLHELFDWPQHFLALPAAAVAGLADDAVTWANAISRLHGLNGRVLVPERCFARDPGRSLFSAPALEPHEKARPAPWGGLSERLHEWISTGSGSAIAERQGRPVTLHITHSWGGGVQHWVDSFMAADTGGFHLQLRSEAPQSGQGAGQRLALYAGRHLDCPVDSWWLQPPIPAVQETNAQYRDLLDAICGRFAVGRILVSSLVGHSLDALRTGLPTVQVLHDHFPAWPLFSAHPSSYEADLEAALGDPRVRAEFPQVDPAQWRAVQAAHHAAIREHGVLLAAPSNSVVDIQRSLGQQWAETPIAVIPHGFPALPEAAPVAPREREDGRLRLVIPGRIQPGKGAALLLEALPALTRHAQVYLLGAGKEGEQFFGKSGVNVLPEYQRDELPRIIAEIGPHLAALLSLVPETFSYTLSEMTALGVPAIATRVGSFAERVQDGENGWLIEPRAGELIEKVAELALNPRAIEAAREQVRNATLRTPQEMVADYRKLCAAQNLEAIADSAEPLTLDRAQVGSLRHAGSRARSRLEQARHEQAELRDELRRRTRWAEDAARELEGEIRRRERWVAGLEADLADSRAELRESVVRFDEMHDELKRRTLVLEETSGRLEETSGRLQETLGILADTRGRLEHLQDQYSAVLSSHSWRLTRPLRAARRMAANFRRSRAWNPLRWPVLLSQLVRNVSTLGVKGALLRMQRGAAQYPAPPSAIATREETLEVDLPVSVPCAAEPVASIVIPVFNHIDVTSACLQSVAGAECATPFEIIVVDDASTDVAARGLEGIEGLTCLRNTDNRGFIRSCNRGASAARGEFLVMLNNDTEVRDGWLDRLLALFQARPDAGLVGARLVYPDGRLQECGGMVFRDGSGWNYGRDDDPARPEYQYPREVDYCSGACIAIRADLFDELGGFDEHFAPAYYEDTDLAFRVREKGLKVYVQPSVSVIHHEGLSSGTDETAGTKRYQAMNRDKFLERWKQALESQPARIRDPGDAAAIRAARDHRLRGRVLVIDAYTPEPDQDSGSVRLTHLMRCLRDMGYGVTFFADNRAYAGRYTRALQADGVEAWYGPWLESTQDFFRDHGAEFDFVFISRHYIATHYLSLLKKYCPRAKFVFDTVDLHYLREERLAQLEGGKSLARAARQTRKSELAVIEAADATMVVSPVERDVLARDAPQARVHVLSNIHAVNGSHVGFAERSDLFFVGGYQHPPNIDAACWFVRDIWPLIHEQIPEAQFHLVGSKAPDEVRELAGDGVVFHGFVEDLDPFLDRCRLAVAPLRYGAGVKGKVNHSMSHGQPVVATPMAVEGMHAEHEREILVAEDAQSFADQVARLYRDEELWNRISGAAVENVRRHFSIDAARAGLEELFAGLAQLR